MSEQQLQRAKPGGLIEQRERRRIPLIEIFRTTCMSIKYKKFYMYTQNGILDARMLWYYHIFKMKNPALNMYSDYNDEYWYDDYNSDTDTDSASDYWTKSPEHRQIMIEEAEANRIDKINAATIIKRHIRGYIARKNYSCPNPTTQIGRRRLLVLFNAA